MALHKLKPSYSLDYLFSLVSDAKCEKIKQIIQHRTRYISLILEGIQQPHNASAVIRSCDIFGIQDVHVVEGKRTFKTNNEVAKGASKWVDIYHHDTIATCANKLKKDGYTIVATTPHAQGYSLNNLPLDNKIALMFGTELHGLTQSALSVADAFVTIPMVGFTQSFNISVSAGICLYDLVTRLHASEINWQLPPQQQQQVQQMWLERVLRIERASAYKK